MRIRIAQCLCPQRHTIAALLVNEPDLSDAHAREAVEMAVAALLAGQGEVYDALDLKQVVHVRKHCALCGAPDSSWLYEVGWSQEFDSWEEAVKHFKEAEAAQSFTRSLLHALGLSYDARKKREMN